MPEIMEESINKFKHEIDDLRCRLAELEKLNADHEQKKIAWHKNESQYRLLLKNNLSGYLYIKIVFEENIPQDFVCLDANRTFEEETGLQDVIGKKLGEVFPGIKENNLDLFDTLGRVGGTGEPEKFESYIQFLKKWFLISAYRPEEGFIVVLFNNITGQKLMEGMISVNETRWQTVCDASGMGIGLIDQDGRFIQSNAALQGMLGYSRAELNNLTYMQLTHPGDAEKDIQICDALTQAPTHKLQIEKRFIRKDGETIWGNLTLTVLKEENNQAEYILGVLEDISERKHAEEALRISEERYRLMVELAPEAILVYDVDLAKIVDVNHNAEILFGYKRDVLCSQDVSTFYAEAQPDKRPLSESMENHINRALDGEVVVFERTLINADGIMIPCEERLVRLPSTDHRLLRASYVDISERKRAEAEIRDINDALEMRVKERTTQLELVNQELTSLSFSMAHSLRTPLRALDGFSYILMEEYNHYLDDTGKDYLNRIRSASRNLWQVTDDLLELMSIARGDFKISQVNLSKIAQGVMRELKTNQPERRVDFICPNGLNVDADSAMVQVLMENLLGNAWKFTRNRPFARIELGSLVKDGQTVFFISDNGVGIDMTYYHKLFGVFQRLHSLDEFEGSGVGLAIAQRIVHRHGGRIWAEGVVGQGTTIYFTLGH